MRIAALSEMLWSVYEAVYGHRSADVVGDPFDTATRAVAAVMQQRREMDSRIAALESMLRVCRSAFEQRGLMTYVWEIDSTTARAAIKEGK